MLKFRQWQLNEVNIIRSHRDIEYSEPKEILTYNGRLKKNLPKYVYHGTDHKSAENILKNGVRSKGISLTSDLHYAALNAMGAVEDNPKSHGVILKVHTRGLDPKSVEPNDVSNGLDLYHNTTIDKKHVSISHIIKPDKT